MSKEIEFVSENKNYAIVLETRDDRVFVLYNNAIVEARLIDNIKDNCNKIIFPGDRVILNNDNFIEKVVLRKNILSRDKYDGTRDSGAFDRKIIACNIDLAVIVVSFCNPPLHSKFIDRYLLLLQNCGIKSIICVNKCDIKSEKEENILDIYRNLGIIVIETSTNTLEGISKLKKAIDGSQTIFVGHSGVGKSSLIKCITGEDIKIGRVGEKTGKGKHTTTSSRYYKINNNTSIIDTPGIRSLDVSRFSISEIKRSFMEFTQYENLCKYDNCLHYDENECDCAIKRCVKRGIIKRERYDSYRKLIKEVINKIGR